VKPGHRVLTVGAPPGFPPELLDADGAAALELVDDLPGRVAAHDPAHVPAPDPAPEPADVLLLFCPDAATMTARLPAAMELTAPHGRCWVAWPKKASKVPTDLTEDVVRAAALAVGWVDVKVCAVDGVWSGLCLMRRAVPLRSSS
jgi:hypothetical protein